MMISGGPPQTIYATWDRKFNAFIVHESKMDAVHEKARASSEIDIVEFVRKEEKK